MVHCFDYLRQSLLCAGDVALEGDTAENKGADGWGYVHVCKNRKEMERWIDENRFTCGRDLMSKIS